MKRHGALVASLVALGFGALAVILANQWMVSRGLDAEHAVTVEAPAAKVVVAAKDIDIGTPLTEETLTLAKWPKANVPEGAFDSVAALAGRVAKVRLVAGEPLLASELAAPGSGAGLVALIAKGMRAMSIKVDEVIGVSGFILPNTFVDVLSVDAAQGVSEGEAGKVTTILERIRVLAIAQETFTEDGKAKVVRTVTLEVSPEQGEKLVLHTNNGAVHLVLRNPLDPEQAVVAVKEVPATAVPVVKRPAPRPPESPPFEVEVIKGKDREKIKFEAKSSREKT